MATKKEVDEHLAIALNEIGQIKPWFEKDVNAWVFCHSKYPEVEYGGESKKDVIENYPKYLREFIKHRLNANLAPRVEKATKGRGGRREGAGRPKGTRKEAKKRVYLPKDVAEWIGERGSISQVRSLIAKGRS
jgi:hypothetical protein